MLRTILTIILPIALPFLIFWFYLWTQKVKARRVGAGEEPGWAGAPWGRLIIASAALLVATLLFVRFYIEEQPQVRGEPQQQGDPAAPPAAGAPDD
jgi:hypothetical protein